MKLLFFRICFLVIFGITGIFSFLFLFSPILTSSSVIIPYSFTPFDICIKYPEFWYYFKIIHLILNFFSWIILGNSIYSIFFKDFRFKNKKTPKILLSDMNLYVGDFENRPLYIPDKSLYQNILVTGTTGSGKTSSAMYPFCRQLIEYEALNPNKKLGMLILDVKGNFYKQVISYAESALRLDDVVVIKPGGNVTYNPLNKPLLKASVLADRLKEILLLFSPNNTESYWLDKASQALAESIKLCRLYNDGYVTFTELHKLLFSDSYFNEKIQLLKYNFQNAKFNDEQCFELLSALDFFQTEFKSLDERVLSILKSEISRITSMFVSDYSIQKTFCPKKNEETFIGFSNLLSSGKIVLLNMNLAEYQNLSKFMAAYLKLDFQSEVLNTLTHDNVRPSVFMCDEFHEFVTKTDARFFCTK